MGKKIKNINLIFFSSLLSLMSAMAGIRGWHVTVPVIRAHESRMLFRCGSVAI